MNPKNEGRLSSVTPVEKEIVLVNLIMRALHSNTYWLC